MCGICGFYDRRGNAERSEDELVAMGEMIRHRGPDSHGSTLHAGVGLHSRRLSIIDVEGGDQPIFSEDGRIAVVYNGEIYNFQELRKDLESKGHRFRTRSDTEVLVYLYLEYGPEKMLGFLNGFFAFALHDRRSGELFLVRDRMGVKPLYYSETRFGLVFGSELKTLVAEGNVDLQIDPTALVDFLCLRYIPAPKSIYRSVKKLPAGHYLRFDGRNATVHQWWDLPEFGTRHDSPERIAEELWELLLDSVRLRLISEVPLGAFLSGGLDSSAVVAAMHQLQGDSVTAISIGFQDWDQSELEHARRVASSMNIRHVTDVLVPDVLSLVEPLAFYFDEPFADPSAIPTYLLSRRARQEVTVALSGDGADESFAGYRRYRFDQAENRLRRWLPGPVFRSMFSAFGRVYPKGDYLPRVLRAQATLRNLGRDPLDSYFHSVSNLGIEEVRPLLHPDLATEVADYHPRDLFRSWYDRAPASDPLSRIQYLDFHTYLPDYIMTKTDRASMANSLEAREPLLDYRLVELAASLPADFKLHKGVAKWILKQAARPHLPDLNVDRTKQGFHPPLKSWIDADLKGKVEQLKAPRWIRPDLLKSKAGAHLRGLRDHSELLYAMLVLGAFERQRERSFKEPLPALPADH